MKKFNGRKVQKKIDQRIIAHMEVLVREMKGLCEQLDIIYTLEELKSDVPISSFIQTYNAMYLLIAHMINVTPDIQRMLDLVPDTEPGTRKLLEHWQYSTDAFGQIFNNTPFMDDLTDRTYFAPPKRPNLKVVKPES